MASGYTKGLTVAKPGTLGGMSASAFRTAKPLSMAGGQHMLTPRAAAVLGPRAPAQVRGPSQIGGPHISSHGHFGPAEQTFRTWLSGNPQGKGHLWQAWHAIDYNGNGCVSLAEIDKWVVETFPDLDNKPALMRAYKASSAGGKDGFVHKIQFPVLLRDIVYFNKLWDTFEDMDEDTDRRLSFVEFHTGLSKLGLTATGKSPHEIFNQLDTNKGGLVLFDEFCRWVASVQCPVDSSVYDPALMSSPSHKDQHELLGSIAAGAKARGQQGLALDHHLDAQPRSRAVALGGKGSGRGAEKAPADMVPGEFKDLERRFAGLLKNKRQLHDLWSRIDYNGNGLVSLAEIDRLIVEQFPVLDNKPALMRAYKATVRANDDFVHKSEFRALLRNLLYFGRCWGIFELEDADHDRRMQFWEFQKGCGKLGLQLSPNEAKDEFDFMDSNGGGMVLFDEFCKWVASKRLPLD